MDAFRVLQLTTFKFCEHGGTNLEFLSSLNSPGVSAAVPQSMFQSRKLCQALHLLSHAFAWSSACSFSRQHMLSIKSSFSGCW